MGGFDAECWEPGLAKNIHVGIWARKLEEAEDKE